MSVDWQGDCGDVVASYNGGGWLDGRGMTVMVNDTGQPIKVHPLTDPSSYTATATGMQ